MLLAPVINKKTSDEVLFEELRVQVNQSRNSPAGHDRVRTRKIAAERARRGWKTKKV
jgi:hypothetical protein